MPFIPTPRTARLELRYDYHDVPCENVLHFEYIGTPDAAALATLNGLVRNWWVAYIQGNQPVTVTLREIYSRGMAAQASPQHTLIVAQQGTQVGAGQPGNVTFCLKLTTGLTGRSWRGRTYHIGLIESEVTGNELAITRANALAAAYGELRTTLSGSDWTWVVNSLYTNKEPRTQGINTPITGVSFTDNRVDSQRGRLK